MKKVCIYFQVHQPYRLRTYRFFDIGLNHNYFDDYANRNYIRRIAERCYLPANQLLYELITKYKGKFKISFSLSGVFIDQMLEYAPDVLESFQRLAKTKQVEFLAETYSHSLVSLKDKVEFQDQIRAHSAKIEELFNYKPKVFRNTELVYSNQIGADVFELGYEGVLAEGAKAVLGWRSPNFVYANPICPKQKVLLRNFKLSDDIAFRFSNQMWDQWPLTAEKYVSWFLAHDSKDEIINIFMDYETIGEHQRAESGIFEFLRYLPEEVLKHPKELEFITPSEAIKQLKPISPINVEHPTSWADEERDLTAWLGNDLQQDAFNKLYEMQEFINMQQDAEIKKIYRYLQTSDHFYYMSTKWFSDGEVHKYFNPFGSPYEAYINFRNVLNDFMLYTGFTCDIRHDLERLKKVNRRQEEIILELKHLLSVTEKNKKRAVPKKKSTDTSSIKVDKAEKTVTKSKSKKETTKQKDTQKSTQKASEKSTSKTTQKKINNKGN
ncbi:MAG TPA: glycoside hydrolase family 57 protein [Salinivirgaceae bacterium]|nr:glycoside hydrolase family 57 protein [Salinivirgaceae bacterium]